MVVLQLIWGGQKRALGKKRIAANCNTRVTHARHEGGVGLQKGSSKDCIACYLSTPGTILPVFFDVLARDSAGVSCESSKDDLGKSQTKSLFMIPPE